MKGHEQPAIVNTNSQDETSASDIIGFGVRDNRGGGGSCPGTSSFYQSHLRRPSTPWIDLPPDGYSSLAALLTGPYMGLLIA